MMGEDQQREDARHHLGLAAEIGKEGLKSVLIVNGGAAIALTALAGSLAGHDTTINIIEIGRGVIWFGIGAFVGVAAHVTGYLSQLSYGNHVLNLKTIELRKHLAFNVISLVLVLASLGCGAVGLYRSGLAVGIW